MADETMGVFSGFVYSINVMIGAGFLGIPYGFSETGYLLSFIYLIILCLLNNYLSLMFLEVIHKAMIIQGMKDEGLLIKLFARDFFLSPQIEGTSYEPSKINDDKRIDASIAMSIIFGKKFGIVYLLVLTLLFEGVLIAYCSIFASSLAANIPLVTGTTCNIYKEGYFSECIFSYWVFLFVYGSIVITLTIKGIKEQRVYQIIMCTMRFVIICVVVFSCAHLIVIGKSISSSSESHPDPIPFNFSNTGIGLPIILFALFYQLQMPSVTQYVKDKKNNLWKIVTMISIVSFIWYGALGLVIPFAIDKVETQVTLNFKDYTGGKDSRNFIDYAISLIVLLFPAFDVISSYSLISISIVDNWKSMLYGTEEISKRKFLMIKLIISGIPLIVSFVLYDIGVILDFVGLSVLFLFQIMIPIAHISVRMVSKAQSSYDVRCYWKPFNLLLSFAFTVLLVYLLVKLIIHV
ncbi:hypothetical protein SteCoe_33415 [Stentor coeruleus]|uniref:Amino acid transporter transmembrane domain-containing protein n=1 Tax=Stentor coeruleus TaxID=5963 RepID=A0A1R2AWU4_9CILI|nr:hypothetical protein SteCoe_33415 [Stentor coeruleus]